MASNTKETEMDTTKTTALKTSHETYLETQAEIDALLKKIKAGLTKHSRNEKQNPRNWGYVGDLQHIASELQEVSDFLYNEGDYAS